ncbi:NADH-quinone oxidoreductase subunit L, partial [Candidatus Sumerlaeota bacterium]|nr:NADH-quinone oxidoreductase subunit L [Candidatus Sumerlaeota bacterium]
MNGALIWIIPLLPFSAFLINGLFGRWLKEMGGWIAVCMMGFAALLSAQMGWQAAAGQVELPLDSGPIWDWISVGSLQISVGFHYDQLTAVMLFVVTFVGALVFLYSIGYMRDDPGFNRFFAYLSLFAFSMLILVLGDSFPTLFVGWEGVGLCSYLLIGYYLDMPGAPDAGKKAFIVNRVGDAGFLLAMFLIFKHCGTLNIADVIAKSPEVFVYGGGAVTATALLLFLGCTGKSAQIPLFIWLPDAMAGPTPVSALIHAATMVTAGVYLVARTSVIFALAPAAMQTVAVIGALTAFVAGSIALTQRDIKKVLAYSTVSQLGYMFLACGVGAFSAGIFHVMTHAFFKGCLFLGAGAVIHAVHGNQDLNLMGGLRKKIPLVWLTYAIACLAISGFPPFAGFFSKDEILWRTFSGPHPFLYIIALATALMTVFYSFGALFLYDGEALSAAALHNASPAMVNFYRENPRMRPGPEGPARRAALE